MTSTELTTSSVGRGSATRPPTGLLLSIGDKTLSSGGREIPTRIDWLRPKEGQLEQYSDAVAKYFEVYGEKPKQLDDLYFLSNNIGDVVDIRLKAWGTSGIRIVGATNYATLPRDEWEERAYAFNDDVTFWPLKASEIKNKAMRDSWNGEPIPGRLEGPDDPRIEKYGINVECSLTFCLPKVMGFGTVAQITTKSKRSMRNLVSSVHDQWTFFQQQLIGIPFRLTVRPARAMRFDAAKRERVPFNFYELVLDTPFTVQEAIDAVKERRLALGAGQSGPGSPEARALTSALQLPAGTGEEVQLREEPSAPHLDDALLNRIAALEEKVGVDAAQLTLRGVFDVDDARELDADAAGRYEQMLTRAAESIEDAGEPEVMYGDEDIEFGEPR